MSASEKGKSSHKLTQVRDINEAAINSLIADLTCDDVLKCQKARHALVAIGSPAVPALVKALGSRKQWVRWEAAKALGQIGDPSATQALVEVLLDKMFDVRWLAAEGLIKIGRPSLVHLLSALEEHADSIWMQRGAHHVLSDLTQGDLREILKPVLAALEGIEPELEVPLAAHAAIDALKEQKKI